ncbi:MAG: lysylphosphatidylglycerol synthase domain-containing protein [Alphaproteobacteria bacterium]|nr:lysylphosphatidylglycerol synthase domain-containing protein [Alphaproteobacteria bacterium]
MSKKALPKLAILLGIAGLTVAIGVIIWTGWEEVLDALHDAGFGILVVAALHIVSIVIAAYGWTVIIPGKRPSVVLYTYFMWIRAGVNNLLPAAKIGGEIVSIRLMILRGIKNNIAIASTIVELTLSIAATFVFVALGALLFALKVNDADLSSQLFWGLLLSSPFLAALFFIQKYGVFSFLSKIFKFALGDKGKEIASGAGRIDKTINSLYKRKNRILACSFWQFASWVWGGLEIWAALYFLGYPVSIMEAMMLEALIIGTISAAFAVPAALGVQEAGYVFFGGLLGLPPHICVALAVIRRCRDLLIYVPALITWQIFESKRIIRKRADA